MRIGHRKEIRISLWWPIHIIDQVDNDKLNLKLIAITILHRETEIRYGGRYLETYTYMTIFLDPICLRHPVQKR